MRFGIFDHLERREVSLSDLFRERLDFIRFADRAGFWCYHKAEHHGTPLDAAPAGNLFLAAATQHTERIRFGPLVYLLPFHHPIRLVEEICMIDHLSEGRLEVGVGRGISPPEHVFWGLNPEQSRAITEEALDVVIAGLGAKLLNHKGRFFSFDAVSIEVAPFQKPRPNFWYPGNPEYAARRGLHTVLFGPPSLISEGVEKYQEIATGSVKKINEGPPVVGGMRHVLVAETDAEAERRGRRSWVRYTANLTKLFRQFRLEVPMDPTFGGDFDKAREARAVVVGSPKTVGEEVEEFARDSGSNYYIGTFAWGDLEPAEYMASIGFFAEEVMPAHL